MEEQKVDGAILVVEVCYLQRNALTRVLEGRFKHVIPTGTLEEALNHIAVAECIQYAVLDLMLPDGNGLDLIPILRKSNSFMRIVVWTAHGSIASAVEALHLGADDYLTKPSTHDQLLAAIHGRGTCSFGKRAPFPRPLSLDRIKWEHIQRVLSEAGWNISEAARRLGIHRQSLQRTLRKPPTVQEEIAETTASGQGLRP